MMAPVLEELAADADLKDTLQIYKINTDEPQNQMLAMMFDIRSIPNMKLFKDGKVVADFVGLRDKDSFKKELQGAMQE
jgi:thioredoxin 1